MQSAAPSFRRIFFMCVSTMRVDGVRAAECAAAQSFDLILLDLMLPGIDGFEVCNCGNQY